LVSLFYLWTIIQVAPAANIQNAGIRREAAKGAILPAPPAHSKCDSLTQAVFATIILPAPAN
jgi:hypothetical protein